MVDIVDKATRSRMMSGIRGRNTQPELALRRALHRLGFRYRLHVAGLAGRPDIVLPKYRSAIQVHGCFWHRHKGCRFATTPASNPAFWQEKFSGTIERDQRTTRALLDDGWRVAIVWECALDGSGVDIAAKALSAWLGGEKAFIEFPRPEK
ncbi:MAG: DNA mismatch endonuclease Vsr [Afipia sp.]|nr:MAG: DNA mismatch endonuclease Vsr [Afipia sp.]